MKLVFLGPPGAGKGTYAKILAVRENLAHISTGDILRSEMKRETPLGKEAKSFVESGKLVPDDLVVRMMKARLSQSDCAKGYILDGFPRTVVQADAFQKMAREIHQEVDLVVYFKISEATVVARLGGRKTCSNCGAIYHTVNRPPKKEGVCDTCGQAKLVIRKDDEPGTVRKRLKVYEEETAPLVRYYEKLGLLREISADLEVEGLDEEVQKLLATSGMK
jgi:adenylate kinase